MKSIFMLFVPIMLGTLISCSKAAEENEGNPLPTKSAHGTDTVNIAFNDTYRLPDHNFYLTLDTIYSDSRCPADVVCIWAGAFQVGLKADSGNGIQQIKLGSYGGQVSDTVVDGVEIRLLDLLPYPDTRKHVNRSDIKVKIGLSW